MKVLTAHENPSVLVAGYDGPTAVVADYDDASVLDLVAHFLGIAVHHNVNAAPSSIVAIKVMTGERDDREQ